MSGWGPPWRCDLFWVNNSLVHDSYTTRPQLVQCPKCEQRGVGVKIWKVHTPLRCTHLVRELTLSCTRGCSYTTRTQLVQCPACEQRGVAVKIWRVHTPLARTRRVHSNFNSRTHCVHSSPPPRRARLFKRGSKQRSCPFVATLPDSTLPMVPIAACTNLRSMHLQFSGPKQRASPSHFRFPLSHTVPPRRAPAWHFRHPPRRQSGGASPGETSCSWCARGSSRPRSHRSSR